MFDGHAVGIPAGDIGGVIPLGVFVFDDDVLQDLVQGMAHVDLAVGVGRSVVEDELLVACMEFLFFSIDIVFIPEIQEIRFPFGQAARMGNSVSGRFNVAAYLSSFLLTALHLQK